MFGGTDSFCVGAHLPLTAFNRLQKVGDSKFDEIVLCLFSVYLNAWTDMKYSNFVWEVIFLICSYIKLSKFDLRFHKYRI